jgi:hypothetical protein
VRLGPPVQILQFQKCVLCVVIELRALLGDNRAKPANKNFAPGRVSALARDNPDGVMPVMCLETVVCPRSRVTTPRDQPGFSDKARNPSIAPRRAILRRDTGQTYREMLTWMAKECGIDTRRTGNLVRPGRVRKGKKRRGKD